MPDDQRKPVARSVALLWRSCVVNTKAAGDIRTSRDAGQAATPGYRGPSPTHRRKKDMMNVIHRCRAATVITGSLLCGLAAAASLGPLAGVASAATSPTITAPAVTVGFSLPVGGSGFTPGGQVHLEVDSDTAGVPSTSTVTAALNASSTSGLVGGRNCTGHPPTTMYSTSRTPPRAAR